MMDMEEQMPELVDISDNEISSTRENLQGSTTENQSVNVTFEDENSRNTPPNPQVLMKTLRNLSSCDYFFCKLVALSDKL